MNWINRHIHLGLMPLLLLLFATVISSCIDDDLDCGLNGQEAPSEVTNGYSIGFSVMLDNNGWGRSSESLTDYDNWIDVQNKFRILLFDNNDNFLFESKSRWVTQPSTLTGYSTWYVTIPVHAVGTDEEEQKYDWEKIREALRTNSFKVAVLANWPNQVDYPYLDGDDMISVINWWTAKNSYYYKDKTNDDNVKSINDLHHLVIDKSYLQDKKSSSDRRYKTYAFLTDDEFKMGDATDWVYNRSSENSIRRTFTTAIEARQWIRDYWNPSLRYNDKYNSENEELDQTLRYDYISQYRHYRHLWYCWNFGGADIFRESDGSLNISVDKATDFNINMSGYLTEEEHPKELPQTGISEYNVSGSDNESSNVCKYPSYAAAWEYRNGKYLRDWIEKGVKNGGVLDSLKGSKEAGMKEYNGKALHNQLLFYPENARAVKNQKSGTNQYYYGVTLKAQSSVYLDKQKPSNSSSDCFIFYARTTGFVRIQASTTNNGKLSMWVKKADENGNNPYDKTDGTLVFYGPDAEDPNDEKGNDNRISVAEDERIVGIFCSSGEVTIHKIEFIRDKYLYDTDRMAISPSQDHPIPMYGVQEFGALLNWEEGSTFDLSNLTGAQPTEDDYDYRSISLLRSVAKVELLIPKNLGHPSHVVMRSSNRKARCEPMDVSTPTDQIWSSDHQNNCEWKLIRDYGPGYSSASGADKDTDRPNYQAYLSWFYGSWKDWWNPINDHLTNNTGPYPHILNSYIDRSDFVYFREVSEALGDNQYYRYELYTGEKNVDDPNNVGQRGSTPKVAHIEIRFDDITNTKLDPINTNDDVNLEDNDCYRIYFTDYAKNTDIKSIEHDGYDAYEKTIGTGETKGHWPLLRNHIYRFVVKDLESNDINLVVVNSEERNPEITFD